MVAEKLVPKISAETVRRVLKANHLRPWRWHSWLSPRVPRDEAFRTTVQSILDLYVRTLGDDEVVLCVDEKTSLQPRHRLAATLPAEKDRPVRVENEYERAGAVNLLAAFNTRSGTVIFETPERKRAIEFVHFLDKLDEEIPPTVSTVHIVLDNLRVHKGKAVQAWLGENERFHLHFPPVHCSWLNQVEQWFAIIQRKLLRLANFPSIAALAEGLAAWIKRWNERAHPFNWHSGSLCKVMAIPTPH